MRSLIFLKKSLIFLLIIFLFSPRVVFAKRTIMINSFKNTLIDEEQFDVGISIEEFTDGETIYFKGAFVAPESTNYFGYTLKNGEWIKNSETATVQFKAIIGAWNQILTVKPDLSDTSFKGPGSYNFKVGFYYYTTTGSLSLVNWSNTVSITIAKSSPSPTSSPTMNPTPSPTPTLTPTSKPPTPTPKPTATYKINEVKDEDGEVLRSSVKVYVDGVYIHHYAPEVLTFCDGCQCDGYVACGFGQHTIKLEKTGYEDWSKEITINSNTSDEVSPVMVFLESSPTSTPTPKILTPTPSQKISPTPTPKKSNQTATTSGEVLGEEVATFSAFYPYEATGEPEENEATPSVRNKIIPKIFLVGGLVLLFTSACWLWYTFKYTS